MHRALAAAGAMVLLAVPTGAMPEQVHASLDDHGMAITWARLGDPAPDVLQWGRNATLTETAVPITASTAPDTTIFTARAPLAAGAFHYRVGSDEQGWSDTFVLDVPAIDAPWRFIMYADHGVGESSAFSQMLVDAVAKESPHMVLHGGDISYADGTAPVWNTWFRMVEPVAARTLYMAAPGNHEHEGYHPVSGPHPEQAPASEALLDPYQQYRTRFALPGDELSYSFDAGPVHVLVLNTEDMCATQPLTYPVPWRVSPSCDPGTGGNPLAPIGQPNQALLDFARTDLAAHQDKPWRFVLMHRPVHSAGAYVGEPILQRHFAPLFEELGVDLVLTGHDHTYQRSFPLQGMSPTTTELHAYSKDEAPIYIVSGGAGEGLYTLQDPTPAWTAARNGTYHFLRIHADADGLLVQAVATNGTVVFDSFTIGAPRLAGSPTPAAATPAAPVLWLIAATALVLLRRRPQGP